MKTPARKFADKIYKTHDLEDIGDFNISLQGAVDMMEQFSKELEEENKILNRWHAQQKQIREQLEIELAKGFEGKQYRFCPYCGNRLSHKIDTDSNSPKTCKYALCPKTKLYNL